MRQHWLVDKTQDVSTTDWLAASTYAGDVLTTQRHEEYLMKKKLLSLAVAGASVVAAQMSYAAGPTVYGKLNVSLQQIDSEYEDVTIEDTWKLRSNASRLGVTGNMEINKALKAIYKLEYEVAVDDGDQDGDEFSQRNIYVGLAGEFGTLLGGNHDTPLKLSQGKADQFNDYYLGDIKYLMVGENRQSNTIMYSTPSMSGFMLTAAIMPGEQTDDEDDTTGDEDDGIADYASVAAEFKSGGLRLAAAFDSDIKENDVIRLVGEYEMDQFQVGLIYQMAEASDTDISDADFIDYLDELDGAEFGSLAGDSEQDAMVASGAFKVNDKFKLKAQYGMADTDFSANDSEKITLEVTQLSLGADYSLSSATTVFGYYTMVDYELEDEEGDASTFGVGIDHKF
jgi:predicted porin